MGQINQYDSVFSSITAMVEQDSAMRVFPDRSIVSSGQPALTINVTMSVLLPRGASDFSAEEYWDSFFKKRQRVPFEWYGSFASLCGLFDRYMKPTENILQIGCGNSQLAEQLYDAAYRNLTNVDLNDSVVSQMKKRNARLRPELVFESMDATNLRFLDEEFNVVFDKGTVDALFSSSAPDSLPNLSSLDFESLCGRIEASSAENEANVELFKEAERVLAAGGRFICITLAQPIVIRRILRYFMKKSKISYIIRIHHVKLERSFDMPTFFLVLFKMKAGLRLPTLFETDFSSGKCFKCRDVDQFLSEISSFQKLYFLSRKITSLKGTSSSAAYTDMLDTSGAIKYRCFVVNNPTVKKSTFAVFICPQFVSADNAWLFKTASGRNQLVRDHIKGFSRVLLVWLNPLVKYGGMEKIQAELSSSVMTFAPDGMEPDSKTPFLSMGSLESNSSDIIDRCVCEKYGNVSVLRQDGGDADDCFWKHVSFERRPFQFELSIKFEKLTETVLFSGCHDLCELDLFCALLCCNLFHKLNICSHKFSVSLLGCQALPVAALLNKLVCSEVNTVCVESDAILVEFISRHFPLPSTQFLTIQSPEQIQSNIQRLKGDVIVLNFDWLVSSTQGDAASLSLDKCEQFLTQLCDQMLPTGCVILRVGQSHGQKISDDQTEADVDIVEKNSKIQRICRSLFSHVAVLKLKHWDAHLLILSKNSLQNLSLLDSLSFKNSSFCFDADTIRAKVESFK